MRYLFFIIMIALLPLRGWVSDAMATEMLASRVQEEQPNTIKLIAKHAHEEGARAHNDIEIVADAAQAAVDCAAHDSGGHGHAAGTHCDACSVCQACHTVALSLARADVNAVFSLRTLPRAAVAPFASAETALNQKPPIS